MIYLHPLVTQASRFRAQFFLKYIFVRAVW